MPQIILAQLDILVILTLWRNLRGDILDESHLHDIFRDLRRKRKGSHQSIQQSCHFGIRLEITLTNYLLYDEFKKSHLFRLGADVDGLYKAILEFDVLAGEGDHGHQAFIKDWLEALLGSQLFEKLSKHVDQFIAL